MSSLLSAELSATCNALGYFDTTKNVYYADDNTLETVKDLIRYLRRDDSNHDIRRQLGETKVLQTDLIPLLKSYWEQTELFDVILRLIVNLTTPALMLWDSTVPVEKHARNLFIQIVDHLQSYKESFTDEGIWSILCSKLSKILEIDFMERGDEYSLIIERILILIRNILYVPPDPYEYRPDNDATVHDQVLWSLHQSGMLDILLYMSSASSEEAYYMHVLEVLSFMFKEQSAHELANAALQRSETEKLRDEAELLSIRHRETKEKRDKIRMYNSVRHSRFGGTFVVKSMKSVGDNELISHKPLDRIDALTFNVEKKKPRTPKNRLPLKDPNNERRSAFSIRLFLKEFCMEFLNASYNTLMHQAKIKLDRAVAQAHDESYYLWAMRFFMEFNRSYKFEVKLVSETMSIGSFHYVQRQMEKYYDMISSDKKNLRLWSRRLHLALLAYRELLYTLSAMEKSQDITVKESARVIKSNIFYVMEYRELILTLLGMYDELKMSPAYLNDLIETQHVFLRMLQSYCGSGQFVTQKKARKKPKKSSRATPVAAGNEEPQLEDEWDEVAPQLSIVLEGAIQTTTDVVPFDAASDVPIDEQKSEAMKNVQRILREGDLESAVGLLRAAREVWPENDCFGSNNMSPEEEFLALRDIYFADLGLEKTIKSTPAVEEHNDEEEEEEEGYDYDGPTEINFQFSDFEKRLARPKIVQACALALRNFERNSPLTNHCIVKLLHRIAWDCKMHAMIFQASVFRTFQEIFKLKYLPQYKELVKFAIFIVRKFIEAAQKNPLIYMEALCWKSAKETYDLEEGYGTYSEKSQAAQKVWTELEEEELKTLFMEHQQKNIEEDVVDWISKNLINDTRSRRAIIHKLKTMYLITNYSKRPKSGGTSSKLSSQWSAAEEQQLRELFEQYEDAMDPLGCIMDRLDVRRPKNRIVEKLLTMGLIHDKKQMRKKRTKKSNRSQESTGDDSFNSGSDDDTNMQSTKASSSSVLQQQTQPKKKKKKDASSSAKKKKKSVQLSSNQLAKLLIEMVEADMGNALEWIKECIDDLVDDIENDPDDEDEGVPIVPIMESSVTAMEDEKFLYLLRAFRFEEPANEQEIYWRIPAHLSVDTLKNYSSTITQAIEKTLIVINDEEVPETNAEINNDGDLSDGRQSRNDDSEVENDENLSRTPSCNETVEPPGNEAPQPARSAKKKIRKIVRVEDSESDSDKENPIDETVNAESTSNKRNRSLLLDSDEDDADSLPTNKKPKKFIDSEDDDE